VESAFTAAERCGQWLRFHAHTGGTPILERCGAQLQALSFPQPSHTLSNSSAITGATWLLCRRNGGKVFVEHLRRERPLPSGDSCTNCPASLISPRSSSDRPSSYAFAESTYDPSYRRSRLRADTRWIGDGSYGSGGAADRAIGAVRVNEPSRAPMDPETCANLEPGRRRQLNHEIGHALARDGLGAMLKELALLRGRVIDLVQVVQPGRSSAS